MGLEDREYPQAHFLLEVMKTVRSIKASDLPSEVQGADIGEMLIQKRIEAIAHLKDQLGHHHTV